MRRNHNIIIRVTKEEKEALKQRAHDLGFDTLTSFVKWCTNEKLFQIQKMSKPCQTGFENSGNC